MMKFIFTSIDKWKDKICHHHLVVVHETIVIHFLSFFPFIAMLRNKRVHYNKTRWESISNSFRRQLTWIFEKSGFLFTEDIAAVVWLSHLFLRFFNRSFEKRQNFAHWLASFLLRSSRFQNNKTRLLHFWLDFVIQFFLLLIKKIRENTSGIPVGQFEWCQWFQ